MAVRGWSLLVPLVAPLLCSHVDGLLIGRPSIGTSASLHTPRPAKVTGCSMILAKPAAAVVGLARRWVGCNMILAPSPPPNRPRKAVEELEGFDYVFFALAGLPPLIAFVSFPNLAWLTEHFLELFRLASPVDGGRLSVDLLLPTANGIVLPTLSIALGTLFATTINVLRQRQVDLRADLNNEVCELRLLRRAIFGCFGTYQHAGNRRRALKLLREYTLRLIAESSAGAITLLEEMQQEGGGGIAENELDELAAMLHGTAGASAARQNSVDCAHGCISTLNRHRSSRVALLTSGFPPIHYGILVFLGAAICTTFLIESNLKALQFLAAIQLQALFAMLVAVCSATAALCFDLADPFRGSFCVTAAARQLTSLLQTLEADLYRAKKEVLSTSVGSSTRSLRGEGRGALGGRDTVLFHLFTSPISFQARAAGDLVTIAKHAVVRAVTSASHVVRRRKQAKSPAPTESPTAEDS
jgi:hypothetical protein